MRARNWCLSAALGALGLAGCNDPFGLDGQAPGSQHASLPVQQGGWSPVDASWRLDIAFGAEGVVTALGFAEDSPVQTLVDARGRTVVAGFNAFPYGIRVERRTGTGQLDPTFGDGGARVLTNFEAGEPRWGVGAPRVLLDGQGGLRLACTWTLQSSGEDVVALLRLGPDGGLDESFGDSGWRLLDLSPELRDTHAFDWLDDGAGGTYLAVNESTTSAPWAPTARLRVARLDQEGQLVPSWGIDGIASASTELEAFGCEADRDSLGRLLLAGSTAGPVPSLVLLRFDPGGSLDRGFGADGFVEHGDPEQGSGVGLVGRYLALDSQDRPLVLADRSGDPAEIDDWPNNLAPFGEGQAPLFDVELLRFAVDGELDTGFAQGGRARIAFNAGAYAQVSFGWSGGDHFEAAGGLQVVSADGAILVAGWSEPPLWETAIGWVSFGATRPFVVRLTSRGELDASLGGEGHFQVAHDLVGGGPVGALGTVGELALDPSGGLILGGRASNGSVLLRRISPLE